MRCKYVSYVFVMLVSMFCLIGLTQSQKVTIKITSDRYPLDMGVGISYYQWDTEDLSQLSYLKFFNWNEVLQFADKKSETPEEFSIDETQFRNLIVDKIFWFSRIGSCELWFPDPWELYDSYDSVGLKTAPTAFTVYKIFSDPKQQKQRDDFFRIALEVVKDPATKVAWGKQKAAFLDETREWAADDPYYSIDFRNMEKSEYESSILKGLDLIIEQAGKTDHSQKVIPGWRAWWYIAKAVDGVLYFISDESPMKMQSAFYRMGPNASKQIQDYASSARKQLFKK